MNRETWLSEVASRMAPTFADLGKPLPPVRMAIGFTSSGKRGKAIGECWTDGASADGTHEIFIHPALADAMRVADVLAHELAHAAVGVQHGHRAPFKRVARAIGLEGKLTATTGGPEFQAWVAPILEAVGPLPHARLNPETMESAGKKKQTTRMHKCTCEECGYTVRVARKWIEEVGAPICPRDHVSMDADLPPDEDDGEEGSEE